MKKINKVFTTITISILVLSLIGIFGTYLSDYLIEINWFGDSKPYKTSCGNRVDWGARHYWYNWGVSLLFITSLARAIAKIVNIIDND